MKKYECQACKRKLSDGELTYIGGFKKCAYCTGNVRTLDGRSAEAALPGPVITRELAAHDGRSEETLDHMTNALVRRKMEKTHGTN